MTLLAPGAVLLLVPFVLFTVWYAHPNGFGGARLPGSWHKLTSPTLRYFLSLRLGVRDDKSALVAAICALLVILTLARPIIANDLAPPANFTARVLVLDMSPAADVEAQRFFVEALLERNSIQASDPTATGLVLVGDGGYSVVPVTTDMAHLRRYQSVAEPSVMPHAGRNLHEGITVAEAMLTDAGITVGQVIVVTSKQPVDELIAIPDSGRLRDVVLTDGGSDEWVDFADHYSANIYAADDSALVDQRLLTQAKDRFYHGMPAATVDLRPPLIVLALLLWLWLLRRRTSQ